MGALYTNRSWTSRVAGSYDCELLGVAATAGLPPRQQQGLWKASLDIQMNQPTTAHPGQTEGTASVPTPYSAAPGRNGAAARRRPRRRRGPASERRSKARATTYQVTLEASRGSIHRCHLKTRPVLPVSMQLRQRKQMLATPPSPPLPAKPACLITVVKRPAGYQLSFTQLGSEAV